MDTATDTRPGDKPGVEKTERQDRAEGGQFTTYGIAGVASENMHDAEHAPKKVRESFHGNAKYKFPKQGLFTRVFKEEIHPHAHGGMEGKSDAQVMAIQKGKPVGEGKKAWPCACGNPEHEVEARVVEVEYKPPVYAAERTLHIPAPPDSSIGELKFGIDHVEFHKDFIVKDSHLRQIARGPPAFRASLRALTCGDTKIQTSDTDTFSDKQITDIARSCPNLEQASFATPGLKLVHTANLDHPDLPTPAFQTLTQCCSHLQSLSLSATRSAPGTLDPKILDPFQDQHTCDALRYLEIQNLEVDDEFGLAVLLKSITKRRRDLEIAHGWLGVLYLYRGGESYLLERDLDVCPELFSQSESEEE